MDPILENSTDLATGVHLSDALRLSSWELNEPVNMSKLQEISQYLNGHPDPSFLIQVLKRSSSKVSTPAIDHFYGYVQLQKQKAGLMENINKLEKEIKYYE